MASTHQEQLSAIDRENLEYLGEAADRADYEDLIAARQLAREIGGGVTARTTEITVKNPDGTTETIPVTHVGSLKASDIRPEDPGNGDHWISPDK